MLNYHPELFHFRTFVIVRCFNECPPSQSPKIMLNYYSEPFQSTFVVVQCFNECPPSQSPTSLAHGQFQLQYANTISKEYIFPLSHLSPNLDVYSHHLD